MNWRFWKRAPERRSEGYTGLLTAALEAQAAGPIETAPLATAALEIAAGLYGRGLAAAVVRRAPDVVAEALAPPVLALMARNLLRRGESIHRIIVAEGRVRLAPVGFATLTGGVDERTWRYQVSEYGPSTTTTVNVASAGMVHARYAVDASRPWLGSPPWAWAAATSKAIAALENLVASESAAAFGSLLQVPETPQVDVDGDVRPLDRFRADLAGAKGRTLVMEAAEQWQGEQSMTGARTKLDLVRFGLERAMVVPWRTDTGRDVLSACGVPPGLFEASGDGTGQREGYRRFLHSGLRPLARIVESELRVKLEAPDLTLDLSELGAADVAGRARSFKALVEAGVDPGDAARETGITLTLPVRREETP